MCQAGQHFRLAEAEEEGYWFSGFKMANRPKHKHPDGRLFYWPHTFLNGVINSNVPSGSGFLS